MHWLETLSLDALRANAGLQVVLETNEEARKHGLELSVQDAKEITGARNEILLGLGRVEFGSDALSKLISAFCTSSYISRDDYASTIVDLLEVFYWLKNASEESISDGRLIQAMQYLFEETCAGSIELLKDLVPQDYTRVLQKIGPAGWEEAREGRHD